MPSALKAEEELQDQPSLFLSRAPKSPSLISILFPLKGKRIGGGGRIGDRVLRVSFSFFSSAHSSSAHPFSAPKKKRESMIHLWFRRPSLSSVCQEEENSLFFGSEKKGRKEKKNFPFVVYAFVRPSVRLRCPQARRKQREKRRKRPTGLGGPYTCVCVCALP